MSPPYATTYISNACGTTIAATHMNTHSNRTHEYITWHHHRTTTSDNILGQHHRKNTSERIQKRIWNIHRSNTYATRT